MVFVVYVVFVVLDARMIGRIRLAVLTMKVGDIGGGGRQKENVRVRWSLTKSSNASRGRFRAPSQRHPRDQRTPAAGPACRRFRMAAAASRVVSGGLSGSASTGGGRQAWIADKLGMHPSMVHRALSRYGLAKLSGQDRATGRSVRRYEHENPGDLVHVDIRKLGRIPDGGGHHCAARPGTLSAGPRTNRPARSTSGTHARNPHQLRHSMVTSKQL